METSDKLEPFYHLKSIKPYIDSDLIHIKQQIVKPPNSKSVSWLEENVSSAISQNSLLWKNSLTPLENNDLNFWLAHDQVMLHVSCCQTNNFLQFLFFCFLVRRFNKTLRIWPVGKRYFCFPSTSMFPSVLPQGNKNQCFPWGQTWCSGH